MDLHFFTKLFAPGCCVSCGSTYNEGSSGEKRKETKMEKNLYGVWVSVEDGFMYSDDGFGNLIQVGDETMTYTDNMQLHYRID